MKLTITLMLWQGGVELVCPRDENAGGQERI